ncbi:hypothetical protein EDD70_0226 [Hydrogenoanaerobacterium saccharovorans]|uniref:Uncharacterized protein n=1 Tax=Hydrogenoanaerobacterium saccharovorans TaxID=474960 RepID=A0A1H8BF79_9FIRM|nr:hypothetical protein [Hydrogenoanaerobacterium saccharovorans]RPF47441.1 hypothetical protein EDD70_0226 [Hydrogenoanaerobacterium saccharovorans]SEM81462.1 hypothetical protein SAMN05216180_1867 [Hydrogenoanaerobacterium saccharovorans]
MPDYEKMYTVLFNRVTDAIEQLQTAQQITEEIYVASGEQANKNEDG